MQPFQIISRYFWLLCLAISAVNYFLARYRLQTTATGHVAQNADAEKYLRRFALAGCVPWLIMGAGQLAGFTPTVWYYFRPQDQNPFVIAWLGSIFLMATVYAVWIFFMDGARKVREFNLLAAIGMKSKHPLSEPLIKLLAALGPFFVLGWIFFVATTNMPIHQ